LTEHQRKTQRFPTAIVLGSTAVFWMAANWRLNLIDPDISPLFEWSAPFHPLKEGCIFVKSSGRGWVLASGANVRNFAKRKTQCQLRIMNVSAAIKRDRVWAW